MTQEDFYEIHCEKSEIYNVKKKLELKIKNFISTEIEWIPLNSVEISKNQLEITFGLKKAISPFLMFPCTRVLN